MGGTDGQTARHSQHSPASCSAWERWRARGSPGTGTRMGTGSGSLPPTLRTALCHPREKLRQAECPTPTPAGALSESPLEAGPCAEERKRASPIRECSTRGRTVPARQEQQ